MFKRLFFAMLGLGAGVAIGVYVTRQMRAAQDAMRPGNLAASAAGRAGSVRERVAAALAEGREAAAAKELELRTLHRVDTGEKEP